MATQTFEELIAGANKIKDNELPESNTHDLVGEQLLQMTNKMQEENSNNGKKFSELLKYAYSYDKSSLTGKWAYNDDGKISYSSGFTYDGLSIPVSKGDTFVISTRGGSTGRAWFVADNSNNILAEADSNLDTTSNPLSLTIEQDNASRLFVNINTVEPYLSKFSVVYTCSAKHRLDELNTKLEQEYYNKENIDEQKKQTNAKVSELYFKFLPNQSISGSPQIDYNHVCGFADSGEYVDYVQSDSYDSAWVFINKSSYIKIKGAVIAKISFFNSEIPNVEGFISSTTLVKGYIQVPNGAVLAIATLSKTENVNGYGDLDVEQENGFVLKKDYINQYVNREIILGCLSNLEAFGVSKNLLDTTNTLENYAFSSGEWAYYLNTRSTGMLFLKNGVTYTASNIKAYTFTNTIYIAFFDINDNYIGRQIVNADENNIATFVLNKPNNAVYERIVLKGSGGTDDYTNWQLEEGAEATEYEEFKGYYFKYKYSFNLANGNILLTGASFAYPDNEWFSILCNSLGVKGYNKAVSGTHITDTAQKMHDGTLYTNEEFEDFNILLIFHSHNLEITNPAYIQDNYEDYQFPLNDRSACWDYVLKKYAAECYAAKDNPSSKWYGTKYGKPFIVVVCTHWHDARTIFNEGIRELQKKWNFTLCELDKNIGFSKNQVHSVTKEQISILHCDNGFGDTEVIDGVTYGWHPTRGKDAWIQRRIACVIKDSISKIVE